MPKMEIYETGTGQELVFRPEDGDVRYRDHGALERWYAGNWSYLGDINDLFASLQV